MPRGIDIVQGREPKKAKTVSGSKNKLKKLDELKAVEKEIDERFKVSEKLFDKKRKLKQQLGIDQF